MSTNKSFSAPKELGLSALVLDKTDSPSRDKDFNKMENGADRDRLSAHSCPEVSVPKDDAYAYLQYVAAKTAGRKPLDGVTKDEKDFEDFTNTSAIMISFERAWESDGNNMLLQAEGEGNADADKVSKKSRCIPLFTDPFSKVLSETFGIERGKHLSEHFGMAAASMDLPGWSDFHKQWTAVRTRFIDDQITRAIDANPDLKQLVNIGSGIDPRAYRVPAYKHLDCSFEVDMLAIQMAKAEVYKRLGWALSRESNATSTVGGEVVKVQPLCANLENVTMDLLSKDTSLFEELAKSKHFQPAHPSILLAEGLIMYLGDGRMRFLDDISLPHAGVDGNVVSAPGSVLILNFMDATGSNVAEMPHIKTASFTQCQLREELDKRGWGDAAFYNFGGKSEGEGRDEGGILNYGRFPRWKFGLAGNSFFSFVVAVKKVTKTLKRC